MSVGTNHPHRRPDILLIMTDQLNPRTLGYAGDPVARTPNVDRLAHEGVIFDAAYTTSPVCMPARCSFVSGRYPHNHRVWSNVTDWRFPPAEATLFRAVHAAGYTAAQIGKFHYHLPRWGEGFDDYRDYYAALGLDWAQELPEPYHAPFFRSEYGEHLKRRGQWGAFLQDISQRFQNGDHSIAANPLPPDDHVDSFVARQAIQFIEQQPTDRPMFLLVSFPGPHSPLDAPGEYATLVEPGEVVLPPNVPETTVAGDHRYSRADVRAMQANYYGKIALIDDWIGRIVDAMRRRGTWNESLVFFTADHGEMMGSHGRLAKGVFFEESARVPLVMRWPVHVSPGRISDLSAAHLDLYATILAASGAEVPADTFGGSLLPLATGEVASPRDAVFSEIGNRNHLNYMVRTTDYKWFVHNGREALFNLARDPFEQKNLVDSAAHQPIVREMHERLRTFLMETQVNVSASYESLFTRAGVATAGERTAELMLELFHRIQP